MILINSQTWAEHPTSPNCAVCLCLSSTPLSPFHSDIQTDLIPKHRSNTPTETIFLFLGPAVPITPLPMSAMKISTHLPLQKQEPLSSSLRAHRHTVFITILPVSEGKLLRSSVLLWGFLQFSWRVDYFNFNMQAAPLQKPP